MKPINISSDQIADVQHDESSEKVINVEKSEKVSVGDSSCQDESPPIYSEEQYRKLKRKADRYLLPLMWLCYGIQQTDKTSLGTQATFGLREDTGLVGQQYSYLTTVFYLSYIVFEFPSTFIIQRYWMGRTLSCYMIVWGVIVLSIGFAQNFADLAALRTLQGLFECSISPGFILIVGTWYTTREHASRALVFQSANAGFGIIAELVLYGIGSLEYVKGPDFQPWRYISYFLGSLTIIAGTLCLFLLGTPSEVRWLSPEERKIAHARIMRNNTGHDRTGQKTWKWEQARECLIDPCFWFAGLNAFLASIPNGGLTTFAGILTTSFGFTNLQYILLDIPRNAISVIYFLTIGLVCSRWKNTRMYWQMFSLVSPTIGFILLSLLPNEPHYKYIKWGAYVMTVTATISLFLAWTLIPSNVAGRTKRTLTSSFTFVGYCVGNIVGSQIFNYKDAPRYIPGTIGCAVSYGLEFLVLVAWRLTLVLRNRRRDKMLREQGLTAEDRIAKGRLLGEEDKTDFENPYFRYTM
ncbi:MFS general substrate transporter [Xylariaceae sp. FL0255]|nr:MFS general substrate transporter [Xylariaceae sp. FL0255]